MPRKLHLRTSSDVSVGPLCWERAAAALLQHGCHFSRRKYRRPGRMSPSCASQQLCRPHAPRLICARARAHHSSSGDGPSKPIAIVHCAWSILSVFSSPAASSVNLTRALSDMASAVECTPLTHFHACETSGCDEQRFGSTAPRVARKDCVSSTCRAQVPRIQYTQHRRFTSMPCISGWESSTAAGRDGRVCAPPPCLPQSLVWWSLVTHALSSSPRPELPCRQPAWDGDNLPQSATIPTALASLLAWLVVGKPSYISLPRSRDA